MTSNQLISLVNTKPIYVTALKDLSLNTTANAFIPKGMKFKLTSTSSVSPSGGSGNLNTNASIVGTTNINSTVPVNINNPAISTLNNNIEIRQVVNGIIKRIQVPISDAIRIGAVKNISSKAIEYSSNIDGGSKTEKYKFTRDFSVYPKYPEGMATLVAIKSEPTIFKKGEIVEGEVKTILLGGTKGSIPQKSSYLAFSKNGWANYEISLDGNSPLEKVLTADLPQRQVDSTKSVLKEKSNSIFTTKNLVISLAVAGLLYGIYTICKK